LLTYILIYAPPPEATLLISGGQAAAGRGLISGRVGPALSLAQQFPVDRREYITSDVASVEMAAAAAAATGRVKEMRSTSVHLACISSS